MCGECRSLRERQLESSTNGTNSLLGIIIGAEQTIPLFPNILSSSCWNLNLDLFTYLMYC
jgi:hypothetical protein